MFLKWLGEHWLDVLTAIGILYGIVVSTYNFFMHRRTSGRKLELSVTLGEFRNAPSGISSHQFLFVDIVNIGYCPITITKPYFELPDGQIYDSPECLTTIASALELNPCKRIGMATRVTDIMKFSGKSCGYIGEVLVYGVTKDLTEKVWKSKKPWRLGLRDGKQKNKGKRLESKAVAKCQGNYRDYKDYSSDVDIFALRP